MDYLITVSHLPRIVTIGLNDRRASSAAVKMESLIHGESGLGPWWSEFYRLRHLASQSH